MRMRDHSEMSKGINAHGWGNFNFAIKSNFLALIAFVNFLSGAGRCQDAEIPKSQREK